MDEILNVTDDAFILMQMIDNLTFAGGGVACQLTFIKFGLKRRTYYITSRP